jgi:non-canonical (house-cleaning) NTP pyrophosphatase
MSQRARVYMSTESALKHAAVARALERVGILVDVDGKKLDSGVNEQPLSIDETYLGAKNRHEALRKLNVDAEYLATVESGMTRVQPELGLYGCVAVILERVGGKQYAGFSIDIEFPNEIFDVVPSVYADVGVWAQEVHGTKEKDPYPYLTGGRLTRRDTVEAAAFNAALRLDREAI